MNFLSAERETVNSLLPGLDEALSRHDFMSLECENSPAIAAFRESAGAGLLIPKMYSGLGADAVDAVRIQRAIGSRSPSLAVATTMHHFSVATLVSICSEKSGMEWILLQAIAQQRLLLASGFAEGESGQSAMRPRMQGRKAPGGVLVSGSKRPCSLSRSMNLLTASLVVEDGADSCGRFAVALIPAESPGIERRSFWNTFALAGAESDEIELHDVFVPERLIFYGSEKVDEDQSQRAGFLWFELLITASYLGAASALVELVIAAERGTVHDRCAVAAPLEHAMAAVESVASRLSEGNIGQRDFARALLVRYETQQAIERATARSAELMGGMAFVRSPGISYLCAASRALCYHPPARLAASKGLSDYLAGADLKLQ